MGATNIRILFRQLLPQMQSELILDFLVDFSQVMFLIGQLAVLHIYTGGGDKESGNKKIWMLRLTEKGRILFAKVPTQL